jgi:septum site-determining protein MinD
MPRILAILLTSGIRELVKTLRLDVLLIDTHPGLNEETLLSIALTHTLLVVMRPDEQDYEGTGVTIRVARRLGVERLLVVVNKLPASFDPAQVRAQVETTYGCEVAAVLPHSETLMTLASRHLFVVQYPDHPLTALYEGLATAVLPSTSTTTTRQG